MQKQELQWRYFSREVDLGANMENMDCLFAKIPKADFDRRLTQLGHRSPIEWLVVTGRLGGCGTPARGRARQSSA